MSGILQSAMAEAGFDPPDHIPPGELIRFSTNGKRGDLAGWVRLFDDGEGAVFGDWRSGQSHTWQAHRSRPRSAAEDAEFRRKVEQASEQAQREREAAYQAAALQARQTWEAANPRAG